MTASAFQHCEFFHLTVLRHLALRLSGRAYAVKGGVCLRFFHRSQRLSHDMDLDVIAGVRAGTLENIVDSILESRSLKASLLQHNIAAIDITKSKQTQTTQRWKTTLRLSNEVAIPTKIEFSRRRESVRYTQGVPAAELLAHYKISPFAAQYYGPADMVEQKILALCAPSRYAVRYLFDLHHLITFSGVKLENLSAAISAKSLEQAMEKASAFTFNDFKQQVMPYLSESISSLYEDAQAFHKLRDDVAYALMKMRP